METRRIITDYTAAYRKLYERDPGDISELDNNRLIVNGVQMSSSDLEQLTRQLEQELILRSARRSMVKRLIRWFTVSAQ